LISEDIAELCRQGCANFNLNEEKRAWKETKASRAPRIVTALLFMYIRYLALSYVGFEFWKNSPT